MKLYTKCGDNGKTSLIGGERVPKYDLRVEAYGTVDELTAQIALLADTLAEQYAECGGAWCEELYRINSVLMSVEALLAVGKGGENKVKPLDEDIVRWIEERVDALQAQIKPIMRFTIPGGCRVVSLSIPAYSMSGKWMRSRTTGMSRVSPVCTFFTLKTTVVPGLPFILSLLSLVSSPFVGRPSISRISSPHCSPFLCAGEPK